MVFRTPVRAKKHPRGNPSGSAGLKLAKAMGTIGRVVRRRPEVMVKVTGSARGFRGLKEHLAYITRNGRIAGEREGGELIEGSREVSRLAEEWWVDCGNDRPTRARDTINLILSMPPGTDPEAVAEAARAVAQKTFGGATI
ncbi:MAG: hypothetical protein ACREU2_17405 [Steroidobacteraceae bacterium]